MFQTNPNSQVTITEFYLWCHFERGERDEKKNKSEFSELNKTKQSDEKCTETGAC